MSGQRGQEKGKARLEDAVEQSFVQTESQDDTAVLKRDPRRARTEPKAKPEKRVLKPGLY